MTNRHTGMAPTNEWAHILNKLNESTNTLKFLKYGSYKKSKEDSRFSAAEVKGQYISKMVIKPQKLTSSIFLYLHLTPYIY